MDRRGFLKRILGVAAFVVATEVGLGNLTTKDYCGWELAEAERQFQVLLDAYISRGDGISYQTTV